MATRKPPGYLLRLVSATGAGESFDCTAARSEGLLGWSCSAASAIFSVQVSHDDNTWGTIETYTASATQTGSAQLTGYYPYVRANVLYVNAATAVSGSATATLSVYWAPVLG